MVYHFLYYQYIEQSNQKIIIDELIDSTPTN